jgi:hypothetical protein
MSIIRISKENIENFSLLTYPSRTFISSSQGTTGSVALFVRNSTIEKDAVPNEDYGSDVLKVETLEEFRRTVLMDNTRYYSVTTGTNLSFTDGYSGTRDIAIGSGSGLFHTSSGMAVGWNPYKSDQYLVFSGSTAEAFYVPGVTSETAEPVDDEGDKVSLRYFATKQKYGGNFTDLFISYQLIPGPAGHAENLTGSHPASALLQSRRELDNVSSANERITGSNSVSLLQHFPLYSLVLQKSTTGQPGTWIDVKRHEPTYRDHQFGKGTHSHIYKHTDSGGEHFFVPALDASTSTGKVYKSTLFNSQSYTQGIEKVYTSSILHNDMHASGVNGPFYFRMVQSGSTDTDIPAGHTGWAIRNFRIESRLATGSACDISGPMGLLLEEINNAATSSIKNKKLDVTRFEPSMKFTKDTLRKNTIRKILFPTYRSKYPQLNWAFTNYHTLNFFTASSVPSNTALIYPGGSGSLSGIHGTQPNNTLGNPSEPFAYSAPNSFTFQFYINPRYSQDDVNDHFKAGTILHLSSSYAISLISGSSRDLKGVADTFKIMLQLSHSADIAPSKIGPTYSGGNIGTSVGSSYRPDLIYTSSEIQKNRWAHIAIRFQGKNDHHTKGTDISSTVFTGSFVINGVEDTIFTIPSASVMPESFENPQGDPDALFIGNFYDGINNAQNAYTPIVQRFFNRNVSYHQGLTTLYPTLTVDDASQATSHTDIPNSMFSLDHPLNAEIHDVRIYNKYKTVQEILTSSVQGPPWISKDMLLYLPVFFQKETRTRDILQTPFKTARTSTNDPFNASLSFGVGGRHINLPNFTKEWVKEEWPRLYHLTASTINVTTSPKSCNYFLYESGSIIKSNLTILPNDNGKFTPNFDLLITGSSWKPGGRYHPDAKLVERGNVPNPALTPASGTLMDRYVSDTGVLRMDLVNLDNMISTASIIPNMTPFHINEESTETINSALQGATPEDPGLEDGPILTILDRTRDASSNEVAFFDASNLFYGSRIIPDSFKVLDSKISGSDEKVKLTFIDNGMGSLYRADCKGPHPKWASYGSIIYEEGIAVITDPTAMHFGKDYFEVTMTGERPVFVKEINVLAQQGQVNSSSNPNWKKLKPNDYDYENAEQFVYITSVNLHDSNFNIIGKANLAQPLVKRDADKYLIRLKLDY